MSLPSYQDVLRMETDTLSPQARVIRQAVATYLSQVPMTANRALVCRFRSMARFMRISPNRWYRAADRLFSLSYAQAENTVRRYRHWVISRNLTPKMTSVFVCHGFRRLSENLRDHGVLNWAFRHSKTLKSEEITGKCPDDLRTEIEGWLRVQRLRNLSSHTLLAMKNELHQFGYYLKTHGLECLTFTQENALAWLESVKASGLHACGYNRRLHVVQRLYAWLVARKVLPDSPVSTFQSMRLRKKLPKLLTEKEVSRLLRAASPGRNRALLEVMYASGSRVGDLCAMDLDKICFAEKTARTRGKGGHEIILYLTDTALRAIQAYLPERARELKKWQENPTPALFLARGGIRLSRVAAREVVEATSRMAGLKHVHPHMLRHSFATHMLNRGADLFSIMRFLGHSNIQSTVRYLQVATEKLSEVHRRYHPRK